MSDTWEEDQGRPGSTDVGGIRVSSQHNARPMTRIGEGDDLAEVIELPGVDAPSFYQRNSGSLPKANRGVTEAHRRSELPRPDNTEKDSFGARIRTLFRR
mgnify:CR=1 FL=1